MQFSPRWKKNKGMDTKWKSEVLIAGIWQVSQREDLLFSVKAAFHWYE
jgi:hypothetical protein